MGAGMWWDTRRCTRPALAMLDNRGECQPCLEVELKGHNALTCHYAAVHGAAFEHVVVGLACSISGQYVVLRPSVAAKCKSVVSQPSVTLDR